MVLKFNGHKMATKRISFRNFKVSKFFVTIPLDDETNV